MLLRSFFSSLILLSVMASATAQTAPVRKTTKTTVRRTTKTRATNTTVQAKPTTSSRQDTGPAGNGAVGSTESADGKGQNVYAAPGMPVNVDNPKKVEGYNGPAPTKPRTGTTLTPR